MFMNIEDNLWEAILSQNADAIKTAYLSMDAEEQASTLAHLRKMSTEDGWHPAQIRSALIAIQTIQKLG